MWGRVTTFEDCPIDAGRCLISRGCNWFGEVGS